MLPKSRIKYIQSLAQKKSRQEAGEFVVEGPKLLEEILASAPAQINAVYALPSWVEAHKSLLKDLPAGILTEIDDTELERISQLSTPNQVLALASIPEAAPLPAEVHEPILVLDTIQDPGNFGTMVRTADWFGIRHLVCSPESADAFGPKVVQSSMGSILRVQVHYLELWPWIHTLGNLPIYATMLDGENLYDLPPMQEGLILVGNESRGLAPGLAQLATRRVTIPKIGGAESLNASVAAGIVVGWLVGRR